MWFSSPVMKSQISDYIISTVVVLLLSCVRLFATPWTAACQASLSFTISQSLRKLMSIELVMSSNHLILCHPLLLMPSIFPSIRVFSNESALRIRWPKYWGFSFSIHLSSDCWFNPEIQGWFPLELTGLISLLSKGLSRVFSSTTVWKHQFFWRSAFSHIHPWLLDVNICFFMKVCIHFRPMLGLSYGIWGSFIAAWGLFSSCSTGLSYLGACGILVPRPEIEPMSPALEGGFLTIGPPGKSHICFLKSSFLKTQRYLDM